MSGGCRCCTPMTRLYVIIGESREYLEAALQKVLCGVCGEAHVDAVPLVHTTTFDQVVRDVEAVRRLARGALVTSFALGTVIVNSDECIVADADAARLGSTDTLVVHEEGVECRANLPHAIAACIPRGYSALLAVRYWWEARLALSALSQAGYKRVILTGPAIDVNLVGFAKIFGIEADVAPLGSAVHYANAVDHVFDYGVLGSTSGITLRLDAPTKLAPCILGHWAARALLQWENVFIDPRRARTIAESILGS